MAIFDIDVSEKTKRKPYNPTKGRSVSYRQSEYNQLKQVAKYER